MKRLCLAVLVAQFLCLSCHSPPANAQEPAALVEGDQLFGDAHFDKALAKYEVALGGGDDERSHARALLGALQCEVAMGRFEAALDRARAERCFERGLSPAGVGRQLRAILASGSRKERLRTVRAPTLVIHGTVDPLVNPAGGRDTAASIPGAKLLMIEGMGHAVPIPMWPEIIDAIDKHAHGASAKAA